MVLQSVKIDFPVIKLSFWGLRLTGLKLWKSCIYLPSKKNTQSFSCLKIGKILRRI